MRVTLEIENERLNDFIALIQSLDYAHISEEIEIPDWQQEEVLKRLSLLDEGVSSKRLWEEAKLEIFKK
jgi:hypothetical protein